MTDAPALELTDVTRRFGDRAVVDQLSFRVARGAVFGFLGPNGAGKTTTLRMILGLVAPTSGRLTVLGAADGRRVRDRIGFLPEERGLHPRMTPLQAAAFLGALKGVPARAARQKARSLLEGLGLGASLNTQIRRLS
ncbi:ATP-binding cassette domain-containing protein, partial [Phenylobacterium sp.]